MKIKEQDSQYLVIVSTLGERLFGLLFTVVAIIFLAVFFLSSPNRSMDFFSVPFIVVPLIFLFIGVRRLMGRRIICDKSIRSIMLESPNFILIRKKRIIPFTDVKNMEITRKDILYGQYLCQFS